VALIFPISSGPSDRYRYVKRTADKAPKLLGCSLKINDILITINDYSFPLPQLKDGYFPNTVTELEYALDDYFRKGWILSAMPVIVKN